MKQVEVEGGELALKNSFGDIVIIPKKNRVEVEGMIKDRCWGCIDAFVDTLPLMEDYAQDGSLYLNDTVKNPFVNNENESAVLSPKFKGSKENPVELKEVVVTEEAPQWLKYKTEFEKNNPFNIEEYVEERFNNPVGREKIKKIAQNKWKEELKNEGYKKREESAMNYAGEQTAINKPQGELSRAEWLNSLSDKEEELVKRNPKYQSSLWADTKRGLTSLIETNPLQTLQNIIDSSDYSVREKQEMLKDYVDHPIISKLEDAAKILTPLSVPSKMVQSTYKDDYSFSDSLKGKKNDAGIVEDVVTDPLNLVGLGIWGKLSKTGKFNKIDDVYNSVKGLNKEEAMAKLTSSTDDVAEKLKFEDFKNDNEFFRIIVGKESLDDIIETGLVRTKRPSNYVKADNTINLDRRGTTLFPSFSKGSPNLQYATNNPEHYIIKTSEQLKPSSVGRHGKGSTMFPTDASGKHLESLDASKVQIYKHTGDGSYELVNIKNVNAISSTDDVIRPFQSEINWAKWNKEIPENKTLMQEYNAIEQAFKESDLWMKNPDGSVFKGTPEQFIQQNSENFKKAFPNPILDDLGNIQYNYHGSPNKFEIFDKNKFNKGEFGKGIYTTTNRDIALKGYAKPKGVKSNDVQLGKDGHLYELYLNAKNPKKFETMDDFLEHTDYADITDFGKTLDDYLTLPQLKEKYKETLKNFSFKNDEELESFIANAFGRKNQLKSRAQLVMPDVDFISFNDISLKPQVTPFHASYPKSAIGNNGMFDITNPNIYKSLIPLIGYSAYIESQKNKTKNNEL